MVDSDHLKQVKAIRICDFGVSKMMNSESLGAETVIGTNLWMAPEIHQLNYTKGQKYDEKVDSMHSFYSVQTDFL